MKKNYYEGIIHKLNYYIQTGFLTEKLNDELQACILLLEDDTLTTLEQERVLLEINNQEKVIQNYLAKLVIRYESFIRTTNILPEDKIILEKYVKYLNDGNIYFDQKLVFLQMVDDLKKNIQKKNEQFNFVKRCAWFIADEDIDKDTKLKLEENMTILLNKKISNEIKDEIIKQSEGMMEVIKWSIVTDKLRKYMQFEDLTKKEFVELEALVFLLESDTVDYNTKKENYLRATDKLQYYEMIYQEYTRNKIYTKLK